MCILWCVEQRVCAMCECVCVKCEYVCYACVRDSLFVEKSVCAWVFVKEQETDSVYV